MKHLENFGSFLNEGLNEAALDIYLLPLDMGFDGNDDPMLLLHELTQQFNLQIVGLIPMGPAGGNPEVTFRGTYSDIENMLRQWFFADDAEQADYYMDEIIDKDHSIPFKVYNDPRFDSKGRREYVKDDGSPTPM